MGDKVTVTYENRDYQYPLKETTYTRDYWLKLYAGMAMQGILSNNNLLVATWKQAKEIGAEEGKFTAGAAREFAQALVDEIFKDES